MTYAVVWAPRSPSHFNELACFLGAEVSYGETAESVFDPDIELALGPDGVDGLNVTPDDPVVGIFYDAVADLWYRTRFPARSDGGVGSEAVGSVLSFDFQYAGELTDLTADGPSGRVERAVSTVDSMADHVLDRVGLVQPRPNRPQSEDDVPDTLPSNVEWYPPDPITVRYSLIGTFAATVPDTETTRAGINSAAEATGRAVAALFRHIARTEWPVLGRQIDAGDIPVGTATVDPPALDRTAFDTHLFRPVCYDFLSQCVRKTRGFSPATDQTRISNLLQRIEQAETCYQYARSTWGLDDDDLQQLVSYTNQIVEMLFRKVEIKSEVRLQMTAVAGTLAIFWLGLFTFAANNGLLLGSHPVTPYKYTATAAVAVLGSYLVWFAYDHKLLRISDS